jgi:hypothetical protein
MCFTHWCNLCFFSFVVAEGAGKNAFDTEDDVVPPSLSSMRTMQHGISGGAQKPS